GRSAERRGGVNPMLDAVPCASFSSPTCPYTADLLSTSGAREEIPTPAKACQRDEHGAVYELGAQTGRFATAHVNIANQVIKRTIVHEGDIVLAHFHTDQPDLL